MGARIGPFLLWLVATASAIAVASTAIAQVGRQVSVDLPVDGRRAEVVTQTGPPATPSMAPGSSDPAPTAADSSGTAAEPTVRTFDTVGGRAAVAVVDGAVVVRWATPRAGFRASVERAEDGEDVRVEFRSDTHRSRIELALEDGVVVDDVEEDDRR